MTITGANIGILVDGDTSDRQTCARRHVILPESLACPEWLDEAQDLVPLKFEVNVEIFWDGTDAPIPDVLIRDHTQEWAVKADQAALPAEATTIGTWDADAITTWISHEYPSGSQRYPDPGLTETFTSPSLLRGKQITVELRNVDADRVDSVQYLGLFAGEVNDLSYTTGRSGQGSEARYAEQCNRVSAGKRPSESYRALSSWMAMDVMTHTLNRLLRASAAELCVPIIGIAPETPE